MSSCESHQRLIAEIRDALAKHGQPIALIGAYALNAYGHSRATQDVDLVVAASAQPLVIELMTSLGFETLHRSTGYSNHLHPVGATRIDFVYVSGESAQRIFDAARPLGNSDIAVVEPAHWVALKLFAIRNDPARRHRDIADVRAVLELGVVDRTTVDYYLERYDLQHLAPEFDDVSGPGGRSAR